MILETLAQVGVDGLGFERAEELIAYASDPGAKPPLCGLVDAMTAMDHESALRETIGAQVIVMTTWPTQRVPWHRAGASRFLSKPFEVWALPELVRLQGPALTKCDRAHARPASQPRLAVARSVVCG